MTIEDDAVALRDALATVVGAPRDVVGFNSQITADALRRFVRGYGDDEHRWFAADPTGPPSGTPPTFLFSFVSLTRPITIPVPQTSTRWQGFWYRDRWQNRRHLAIGEQVDVQQHVESVEIKRSRNGAPRVDLTISSHFDVGGNPVAQYQQTNRYLPVAVDGMRGPGRSVPAAYDAAAIEEIGRRYRGEVPAETAPTRLRVGARVPSILKGPMSITEQVCWVMGAGAPYVEASRNAYAYFGSAGANVAWNAETGTPDLPDGIHWDPAVAHASGMPTGYDRGPQRAAWLGHAITDWLGPGTLVEDLDVRILAPNFLGDLTTIEGSVVSIGDDGSATLELRAVNQLEARTAIANARVRWR